MSNQIKAVSIIGHFGFGKDLLNGQTIKTKIIAKELDVKLGLENVIKTDTHGGKAKLFQLPAIIYNSLKKAKNVIILPAHNGLKIIAPLLLFENAFFKRKLHYVVIGGWLPQFLEKRKMLSMVLKKFDFIYVETHSMKSLLEEQGFNNIVVMPNCKELNILSESELVYQTDKPYKLCTFSRVMKEKGIEDAVEAVKAVNRRYNDTIFSLDIYGQVDDNQTEWFNKLQKDFPEYIRYCGMVAFDKSTDVLKNYIALLFPTYYAGEGFAGTLIDAMAAGIPVVASDWKYNSEIIKDGEVGAIYPTNDVEKLKNIIEAIYLDIEKWNLTKVKCLEEAEKYRPKTVCKIICDKII